MAGGGMGGGMPPTGAGGFDVSQAAGMPYQTGMYDTQETRYTR
jgi:hypothetical protein